MKNVLLLFLLSLSLASCEKRDNEDSARQQLVDISGTYSSTTGCSNGNYNSTAYIFDGGTKLYFVQTLLHGDTLTINVDAGGIEIPVQTFDYPTYDKIVSGSGTYTGSVVNLTYTITYIMAGNNSIYSCNAVLTEQ